MPEERFGFWVPGLTRLDLACLFRLLPVLLMLLFVMLLLRRWLVGR